MVIASTKNQLMGLLFLAALCITMCSATGIDCSHVTEVQKDSLSWTMHEKAAPWSVHTQTKVYKSQSVTDKINEALKLQVPGTNVTFNEAIKALTSVGCSIYIHGGVIRDAILGEKIKGIDVEYSNCDLMQIKLACDEKFGASNCRVIRSNYMLIGKVHGVTKNHTGYPLDVISSDVSLYGKLCGREFTTNSISYDLTNEVLIDSTGTGVTDTCAREINLPVVEGDWNAWLNECDNVAVNSNKKLPRYWKMRSKNFTASPAVAEFITNTVKGNFTLYSGQFRKVFCDLVPESKANENGAGCVLKVSMDEHCLKQVRKFEEAIKADMGEEWFTENIVNNKINRFYVFADASHTANYDNLNDGHPLWILFTGIGLVVALFAFMWLKKMKPAEMKDEDEEQVMQISEEVVVASPARRRGISSPVNVQH